MMMGTKRSPTIQLHRLEHLGTQQRHKLLVQLLKEDLTNDRDNVDDNCTTTQTTTTTNKQSTCRQLERTTQISARQQHGVQDQNIAAVYLPQWKGTTLPIYNTINLSMKIQRMSLFRKAFNACTGKQSVVTQLLIHTTTEHYYTCILNSIHCCWFRFPRLHVRTCLP